MQINHTVRRRYMDKEEAKAARNIDMKMKNEKFARIFNVKIEEGYKELEAANVAYKATFNCKGKSNAGAAALAAKKMTDPRVRGLLNVVQDEPPKPITIERVIQEYGKVAFSNIETFLVPDPHFGFVIPLPRLRTLTTEQKAAIKDFKTVGNGTPGDPYRVNITLHDKSAALTAIMKAMGGFDKSRIPIEKSLEEKSYDELEAEIAELNRDLGRPEAFDAEESDVVEGAEEATKLEQDNNPVPG